MNSIFLIPPWIPIDRFAAQISSMNPKARTAFSLSRLLLQKTLNKPSICAISRSISIQSNQQIHTTDFRKGNEFYRRWFLNVRSAMNGAFQMGGATQPQIKCWATFDFRNLDNETYLATINHIRGKYPLFLNTKFREVPPVEPLEKTEEDYFTIDFKTDRAHISGLYERRGVYLFGIGIKKIANRETDQPFEIMKGIDFNLSSLHFKRIAVRVDYKALGDPGQASYTIKDLINAVNMLALGLYKAGSQWGPAVTTLNGFTSEAIKFITMEQHVVIGLNIIQGNVIHYPSKRLVRILKSWSEISKSIKNDKYDFELKYPTNFGVPIRERVTKFSAGQIIALINSKDESKEEKKFRKQKIDKKGKRKMDDFKESEGRFKKEKIQNLNKSEKGIQISSGSTEGHKYRGMTGARDLHVALNVEDKGQEEIQKAADSEDYTSELFNVRMIPHGIYTDSDSDSDSDSNSEAEDEKILAPEDEMLALYYSKSPKLFNVRMIPRGIYTDSDSVSDSEDEEIPTEPEEETPCFDSPILVKHGIQCPAEAGVSDKDSKLEEMPSEGAEKKPTDDKNECGGSLIV